MAKNTSLARSFTVAVPEHTHDLVVIVLDLMEAVNGPRVDVALALPQPLVLAESEVDADEDQSDDRPDDEAADDGHHLRLATWV
jgi:hypothetical protein